MKAIMEQRRLGVGVFSLVLVLLAYLLPATLAHAASESTLYDFTSTGNSGSGPSTVLRLDGDLYGITDFSGKVGSGTIYRVTPSGHYKVIHNFTDPSPVGSIYPRALINVAGTLYGTTSFGGGTGCGGYGCGVIYSLTPSGVYNVLYSFQGLSDGSYPESLTYINGLFYGEAIEGGSSSCQCGTMFSLTPQGVFTTLYQFQGGQDAAFPAGLTDIGGVLYGTTYNGGGKTYCNRGYGCGTVFSMTLQGVETVIHKFGNEKFGSGPNASLLSLGGALYGTTYTGGTTDAGTVFRVTLDGHYRVLYNFCESASDGCYPLGGLTRIGATLYGTTSRGGSAYGGTVFHSRHTVRCRSCTPLLGRTGMDRWRL